MDALAEARAGTESFLCALLDLFNPHLGGHGRRLAELIVALAPQFNIHDGDLADLRNAALYHDIGMLGIERRKLFTPYAELEESDRELIRLHGEFGAAQLRMLPWLKGAADTVASHHEHWDGSGFPAGLRGDTIPLGARLLAVCDAYDEMLNKPSDAPQHFTRDAVIDHLLEQRRRRFDPVVVETFVTMIEALSRGGPVAAPKELAVSVGQLSVGSVLARDLLTTEGMVMLARGTQLREAHIVRLRALRDARAVAEPIYIAP